jgi:uncharacterized protein (UPF0332 family)
MTEDNKRDNAVEELLHAERALAAAVALLSLGLFDEAVSRAYFAAYHAAAAVLLSAGLEARSHQGMHDLLFTRFVKPGEFSRSVTRDFAALQTFRQRADYGRSETFDAATSKEEVDRAGRFVDEMKRYLAEQGIVAR